MPELPEVETIKRGLEKRIVKKTISNLEVLSPRSLQGKKEDIVLNQILEINRRAKVVAFKLSNNKNLLFHLKMTGQLIYRSVVGSRESVGSTTNYKLQTTDQFAGGHPDHNWHAKLPNSTTALVFDFSDGTHLYFNDLRKFGWCKVLSDEQLKEIWNEYGPEPFDKAFDAEYLMQKASKIPNRNAKQFITDQGIIAGIGNIYADEILFQSRISPLRKVKDIQFSEWKKIISDTKKVLEMGIKYGGTTDSDYLNAEGEKGGMQDHLNVYHKTGEKCPAGCGGTIKRTIVGGRGTHYCPNCQK